MGSKSNTEWIKPAQLINKKQTFLKFYLLFQIMTWLNADQLISEKLESSFKISLAMILVATRVALEVARLMIKQTPL
jgi:hypothetical protein